MPNEKKFKRLPWDLWEPLINQLAEEAANNIKTCACGYSAGLLTASARLDNRTPSEFSYGCCVRAMRIAVAQHMNGKEFTWTPES